MDRPRYSVVVPICNEEETLSELAGRLQRVLDTLDGPSEVILVDDGSTDASYLLMAGLASQDDRFKSVRLSRNFGHQIAITAGLDLAAGDAIVVMDGDLQDPPEVIPQLVERWQEGYDVVYAVRDGREGEPWLRRVRAAIFYRVFRRLTDFDVPIDVGDFRLVDRRALDAFKAMREHNRYIRGMFSWVGFPQIGVPYRRAGRYAGTTKYRFRKLLKLAADGVFSFSNAPLRLALKLGFLISIASFAFGGASIVAKAAGLYSIPGVATLVVATSFLGGIQLVILGVLGEYIARIHEEVKNRPLYLVSDVRGLATFQPTARALFVGTSSERPFAGAPSENGFDERP